VVLEATAKNSAGETLAQYRKDYIHMGIDVDNYQRHGAWQIKEIVDLALQPLEVQKERIEMSLPEGTEEASFHVQLVYYLTSGKSTVVAEYAKKLVYQ